MREIKFRGLRADGKGWVYGYYSRDYIGDTYITSLDGVDTCNVVLESVGQFTGRKDINNIEIFEGDKILHGESERFIEHRGTNFCATRLEKTESILLSFCEEPQIIGNIHETP